jgi:hypothetical protein
MVYKVKFNMSRIFPLLTEGWADLMSIFGFSPLQLITLSYAGNYEDGLMSNFRLVESRQIEDFNDVPFYHSQCFTEGFTTRFDLQLTTENIDKPNLVLKHSNFSLHHPIMTKIEM